jgi:NTP pyrophosphatase (non-canonical NTP hydrolase)
MRDVGLSFEALVRSTADLHERFGTRQTVDEALIIFREECGELTDAALLLDATRDIYGINHDIEREAVDVIVTVLGVLHVFGISTGELADALLAVAKKNDAKTHLTHEVNAAGKIARKEQA